MSVRISLFRRAARARIVPVGISLLLIAWIAPSIPAQPPQGKRGARARALAEFYILPIKREFNVNGVTREAHVFVPKSAEKSPTSVVFGFHGHGGSSTNAAETFAFQRHWREAIIVYMQGLPTPGGRDTEGKQAGWVIKGPDDENRDLIFFDTVLASLKKDYKVDERRIYAAGSSNGGFFTYLLWAARGDQLAAVAPVSSVPAAMFDRLKPKPVLHVAGEGDELVPTDRQKQAIESLRQLNSCGEGQPMRQKDCTRYPSKTGTPVVAMIHPHGHRFPEEAQELIVRFFKDQTLPAAASKSDP